MANLPTPIQKRDILYGVKKTSNEELKVLAQNFLNEGWLSDAIDFSAFANAKDLLNEIKKIAIQEGNTFLYLKAHRMIGDAEISNQDLTACAATAESKGQWRYAIMAYEKLGQSEKVSDIKTKHLSQDGDIKAENENLVFIPTHSEELEGSELDNSEE